MNPTRRLRSPARSFSLSFVVSIPSKRYCPLVGRSRQPRIFNSVDFPEPDGPVIDSHSPRRNTRSTSINASTAGSVPNCLHTLRRSSTWSASAGTALIGTSGRMSSLSLILLPPALPLAPPFYIPPPPLHPERVGH